MRYDLAKQLQEANFPYPCDPHREMIYPAFADPDDWALVPTASEIIAALGDNFGVLERFKDGSFGAYIPCDCGTNGMGPTPEDALAELWLATRE